MKRGRRRAAPPLAVLLFVAGATLFACPGLADLEVKVAPPRQPGAPFVLEARTTLNDILRLVPAEQPKNGFVGRAQLVVRAPTGWRVSGRYRLGQRVYDLLSAPMAAKALAAKTPPGAGARWHGFVSHLHTGLSPDAPIKVTLVATPPAGTSSADIQLALNPGPAPHYPSWHGAPALRTIKLSF